LIETLADRALLSDDKPAFRAYVLEALRTGDALLLVDGLDEITNVSDRASFVRGVQTFLAIYPSVNIVITSRKAGFRQVAGLLASICLQADMSDFDTNDIERLTVSWHREVIGDRPEVIADAKQLAQTICTNDRIKRLAANPLLLTALLLVKRWVGQLPTKRSVLYGKAVEVLLMTWNVEGHEPIEQDEALPQLCYVAYSMMQGGIQKISRAELSRLLMKAREDLAAELGFARIAVTEFIERIESRSSLMMLSGHDVVDGTLTEFYEFRHLTFQEYLTAKAIIEGWYPLRGNSDNIVTLLEPHFTDEKWREVLPLVAVLAGRRAEPLVQKLIETCGKNLAISQRLAKCLADEVQVTREIIQAAIKALLYRGGGWTAERQFIGTGKYGPLLRQEAGAVYLHNGSLRLNVLRAIGEVVLSMIVQSGKPVWNGLKELLESGDILRRCEGALALRLVSTFEGKYLGQMADALLPLLKSKEVAEQLAGCAALHQMGHKKFRTVQDAELSAGFTKRVIEPLLELWIGESEPLIQEAALRALCVLPLDINMRDVEVNGDLREAFLKRTNLWGDLSRDEKVASLVVAFLMGQPWSAEDLLTRSIELNRDLKGYRIKKLRELVTLLGGELPSVTRQSRRGKRRASLDAPDGAMEFENSGGSNVSEEPTTPISWVNAVSNPLS
jgi:hypothetical protein